MGPERVELSLPKVKASCASTTLQTLLVRSLELRFSLHRSSPCGVTESNCLPHKGSRVYSAVGHHGTYAANQTPRNVEGRLGLFSGRPRGRSPPKSALHTDARRLVGIEAVELLEAPRPHRHERARRRGLGSGFDQMQHDSTHPRTSAHRVKEKSTRPPTPPTPTPPPASPRFEPRGTRRDAATSARCPGSGPSCTPKVGRRPHGAGRRRRTS